MSMWRSRDDVSNGNGHNQAAGQPRMRIMEAPSSGSGVTERAEVQHDQAPERPVEPTQPVARSEEATFAPVDWRSEPVQDERSKGAAPRHEPGPVGWETTEQIARLIVSFADLRSSLRSMPSEALARHLLDALDGELAKVGRHLADVMSGHERGTPSELQMPIAIVEWLVAVLEAAGGPRAEALAPVYPSLAAIHQWSGNQ
jgi:hypothetical protein